MGRAAAGVTAFLLTALVLYSSLVPLAVSAINAPDNSIIPTRPGHLEIAFLSSLQLRSLFKLSRPWPLSYLTWLYDPIDGGTQSYTLTGVYGGTYYQDDVFTYTNTGVLTGDFGRSLEAPGNLPVLTWFGLDQGSLSAIYLLWASLICVSMAVACWQRRGRSGSRAWPRRAILLPDGAWRAMR